ncbi:MAG: HlyC/CorC family transporter [Ignavibacteria bacterium]|nr:HlyC/CorC family transporter [Ignavibacteria bacterium]
MDAWQGFSNITLLVLIALLNGFFTASGFALVRVRSTQIEALVVKGHRRAKIAKSILGHLDVYLSATQFGNVMTSVALGWLGEPFVARMLVGVFTGLGIENPQVVQAISFSIAFGLVTFLNIIFGELVPKSIAIQKAQNLTLWIAYPLRAFFFVFSPFIKILDFVSNLILRIIGIRHVSEEELMHSSEEIRLLLAQEKNVSLTSKTIVLNAMDFRRKQARHFLVPRREMVALKVEDPIQQSIDTMRRNKYSRYPVFSDSIDNIIGVVHTKDIFKHELNHRENFSLESVLRDVSFLPETVYLEKALDVMLHKKTHVVILVDEYGGTAGLLTLEDVLEELVGTIQDEFDREVPEMTKITDDEYLVDAMMTTNEIERLMNRELSPKDVLSIGGFVMEQLGHIPTKGESLQVNGVEFTIEEVDERAVEMIRVRRIPEAENE